MKFSNSGNNLSGQEMFKVLDKAKKYEQQGFKVIHLELGQPRFAPPTPLLKKTIESLRDCDLGYSSSLGTLSLRDAVRKKYSLFDVSLTIDNIIISSANLLITQCLHLFCNHNDRVVLFSPAFPTYFAACAFLNLQVKEIQLSYENNFNLGKKDVDAALALKPKAIIVNSGCNPTGAVYSREVLEYLLDQAEKKQIWIISDETYRNISFNNTYVSLAGYDKKNICIISSFSKEYSVPGFRLGYAISNNLVIKKLALSNSTLSSCSSIFTQIGVESAMSRDGPYLKKNINSIKMLMKNTVKMFNKAECLGYNLKEPDAGYYLFINVKRSGMDGESFSDYLLDNFYVACTPGISFGENYSDFIRLSICGHPKDINEGVSRIINMIKDVKPKDE